MTRVLVTDVHQIGGLGVVRSLGMAGYRVFGAAPARWQKAGGCQSRHLHRLLVSPSPWSDVSEYARWLHNSCRRHDIDIVFPVSEAAHIATGDAVHAGYLDQSKVIGPDRSSLYRALDTEGVVALLADAGVRVPEVTALCKKDFIDERAICELSYPAVVHRLLALSQRGRLRAPIDRICYSQRELRAFADECISVGASLLSFGERHGDSFSAYCARWQGTNIAQFVQRAIHEADIGRLQSSLRQEEDSQLAAFASEVLRILDLDGICNVRFRLDEFGHPCFDGITPGVPGSISLPILKGTSIPAMLLDHVTGRPHVPPKAIGRLRRCSNFYPGEIRYLGRQLRPLSFSTPWKLLRGIASVLVNKLDPRTGADYFWWSDWRPAIAQIGAMLKARGRASPLEKTRSTSFTPLAERRKRPRLPHTPPRKILFVCHGNVCRSLLAEKRLRHYLGTELAGNTQIQSAGIGTKGGDRPPERFRRAFKSYGLSIDDYRSRALDKVDVDCADMVIIMDANNLANLSRLGLKPYRKLYYLGAFSAGKKTEIPDPVNAAPHIALDIFKYVDHCVARLAEVLQAARLSDNGNTGK